VPTPVWVVATVTSNPAIYSQSNTLTITTGLPTQDFFSLSVQTYNIEGLDYDGITSTLTIIASDRLGNPVPDGTVINFITEGGDISNGTSSASCITTNGKCSVTFTSAELRPANGRVTILAYAVGEKSFVDANGNNRYDVGETFYDLGDLYLDANENGVWDPGEQSISYVSGTQACRTQPSGNPLPFNYWNVPSITDITPGTGTCTGVWGINYVRRSAVIVLSGSVAYITTPHTVGMGSSCSAIISKMLFDVNNNPMPAGTTLAIANNNVYYHVATKDPELANVSVSGTPVVNTNKLGGTLMTIEIVGADCSSHAVYEYPQGYVDVVVTTPKGLITIIPFTVTGNTITITPSVTLAAGSTSVTASTGTVLTATVTDQFGYGVASQTVAFSFINNNSGGSLSKTSVITNTDGVAIVNYKAGTTSGVSDTIKASISGSSDTVIISVTKP
jgi:hypothetical protein